MANLQERLATVLADVVPVDKEPDGALTVRHDGTFASLRVVSIAPDLDLVSLTQVLAWDLPLTKQVGEEMAKQARDVNFGTVTAVEKIPEKVPQRTSGKRPAKAVPKTVDVMLRYNFPGGGLTDDALRTLVLLVLDAGAQVRRALTT